MLIQTSLNSLQINSTQVDNLETEITSFTNSVEEYEEQLNNGFNEVLFSHNVG